jgi:hypothetical protein
MLVLRRLVPDRVLGTFADMTRVDAMAAPP